MFSRPFRLRLALVGVSLAALAAASGQASSPASSGQARPSQQAQPQQQTPPEQPPPQQQAQPQQQGQQPQQPTFRTGVRLVRVDVTATGRGDEPVADLQTSDFDVTEDGIQQRVEQLQFIKIEGHLAAGDDRSLEIRTQEQAEAEAAREDVRVFALFLDDYHIDKTPAITLPLRKALTRFIDQLWPTDLVALMDPLTPLSALRFTRSHAELLDVITRFEGRQGEIFPVKSVIEEAQLGRGDIGRVRAEVTLSALESLVVRLGGLREGRKVVIFVSQGPPTFFGRDGSLQDRMQGIAQAASRGNVNIYPVDPRGLGMAARGSRDTLYQLAAETGGRAITNTNDPMTGLSRVLADTSAYYVLGYQPTRTQDDGRYHKIGVRVKRPGVHVLARQGYWAPSAKELDAARVESARRLEPGVARALDTLAAMEPTHRPADVWVGAARGDDGRSRVAVTWDPAETGTILGRASVLDLEVLNAENGSVVEPRRTIPAPGAAPAQRPSTILSLSPGPVSLRLTARGEGDAVLGTWVVPFVVPNLSGFGLSTPRVYRARSLPDLRALNAAPDAAPSAGRRFARSDRVIVAFECYVPQGSAPPELAAHLLARDGRELAALEVPAPKEGKVRMELPITSLGQGTYILRIRGRLGDATAEQLVAFTVVG